MISFGALKDFLLPWSMEKSRSTSVDEIVEVEK